MLGVNLQDLLVRRRGAVLLADLLVPENRRPAQLFDLGGRLFERSGALHLDVDDVGPALLAGVDRLEGVHGLEVGSHVEKLSPRVGGVERLLQRFSVRLAELGEAALAFTRAEAATEDTKVLDLGELVREVEHEFLLADKPVGERRMDGVRCACRPVALKRAIRNLIENAVRYGSRAEVSVLKSDQHALIQIDDQGPGIPPDRVAEAFEPFVRLEQSRSTETGGIGLGLAIARSIVVAHGGSLTLSNLPDRGLRAEITLPLRA